MASKILRAFRTNKYDTLSEDGRSVPGMSGASTKSAQCHTMYGTFGYSSPSRATTLCRSDLPDKGHENDSTSHMFEIHPVADSDTLPGLAIKYSIPIEVLKKDNCIFGNQIASPTLKVRKRAI